MAYYKDGNGVLHDDMDGEALTLPSWPTDCTKITNEEYILLTAPKPLTIEEKRTLLAPLSAWQIRRVLTQSGLRQQVEDAVSVADQDTQDAWHYASNFRRDDEILNAMALKLSLTNTQLDNMFELGITL